MTAPSGIRRNITRQAAALTGAHASLRSSSIPASKVKTRRGRKQIHEEKKQLEVGWDHPWGYSFGRAGGLCRHLERQLEVHEYTAIASGRQQRAGNFHRRQRHDGYCRSELAQLRYHPLDWPFRLLADLSGRD